MPRLLCPVCGKGLPRGVRCCPHCATMALLDYVPTVSERLPVGYRLGPYRVKRFVAAGAVANVYEAILEPINQTVALKVIKAAGIVRSSAFRRFAREAKMLAWLNHRNIVALIDAGREGDFVFLAMQYIAGGNLRDRIRKQGPLGLEESLSIITGVTAALRHAWRHRIVHRDIKPGNILLTSSGRPKLADLGLAKLMDVHPSLTPTGTRLGSAGYMAPEQMRDSKSVDIRADVYALGVVWFYCLTRRRPFAARRLSDLLRSIRTDPLPRLRDFAPGVPDWVQVCMDKMCAKEPADRFQDPSELLSYLAAHTAGA